MDEDTGDEALAGAKDSGQSDTEEGERDESRGVEVDRAEGEGGEPLGLLDGKAMGEPWKEGATKKDFFPDGGDDEGIGEEREKSLGVSGFEEAGHGGLGFERKTEKEKKGGAEDEEKKDGKKKSEDGTKGEEKIGEGIGAVQTPEWDRFFLGEREKREPDEKSAGGKEGRSEPRGEGEGGDAEKEQGRWNGQGGKGGGRGGRKEKLQPSDAPPKKKSEGEGKPEGAVKDSGGGWGPCGHGFSLREKGRSLGKDLEFWMKNREVLR